MWTFWFGAELFSLAVWLRLLWIGIRHLATQAQTRLNSDTPLPAAQLPPVSVLVPARNEEGSVRECLSSLLALEYPDFEVIFVNDHSTDRTGEIARELGGNLRLRYMDAPDLPSGWVGKNWALHHAAQAARGELLLMTDADIRHHPLSLLRAVQALQQRRADLVSLLPQVVCETFWERVMMPLFGLIVTSRDPIYSSNDPTATPLIVSGGFLLVRRSILERIGGYEAIRGEMVEDLSLGRRLKQRGCRVWTTGTEDLISTRMYHGLGGIWTGLSKNFFAGLHYSLARFAWAILVLCAMGIVPVASLAMLPMAPPLLVRILGPLTAALMFLVAAGVNRKMHVPIYPALAFPAGCLLYILIGFNSFRHAYTGGPAWKGRRYATLDVDKEAQGSRFKLQSSPKG